MMTLKEFLALAKVMNNCREPFSEVQIVCIADFLEAHSNRFNRERWLLTVKGII